MPNPIALGLGLVGGARALFGNKRYKYREPDPFSYTPDPNDPEIGLRRRRLGSDIAVGRGRYLEELGRAGNLGSGKQFELLGEQEQGGLEALAGVDEDVFMKRRMEALDQYNRKLAFERQRALIGDEAGYRSNEAGLGALGEIGGFLGSEMYGGGDYDSMPFNKYLGARFGGRRNRGLRSSLLEASDYDPTSDLRFR
jgi:hypothetical protein